MAWFPLVQRAVIALILGRRGWFLHHLGFLLHHHTLGWVTAILLLVCVHAATRGFTIRGVTTHQWTRLGVVYGLVGSWMLHHSLIIMKCQILLLLAVATSMSMRCERFVVKGAGIVGVLQDHWALLEVDIPKVYHYMSLRNVLLLLWWLILWVLAHSIIKELFETLRVSEYVLLLFEGSLLHFLWNLTVWNSTLGGKLVSHGFYKTILDDMVLRYIRPHTTTHIEWFRFVMMTRATNWWLVCWLGNVSLTDLIAHELLGFGWVN